jgi:8-amino-7-oxononanoate synthase
MIRELTEELEALRTQGLFRNLRTLSNLRSTHATWNGKELTLFCGNDYLGLARHPRVIQAAHEALAKYGVGAGAARLISGTSELHTELEEALARFKGKERALVFGSGYLANVGVLTALADQLDLIVMDKLCHASLIDGARLSGAKVRVYPHKNYERAGEILEGCRNGPAPPYRRILLVSETVFSMDGDLADLGRLVRLKEKYQALLVVDDAHGTGVFGTKGRGAADGEVLEKIDVVVGTLSKALGVFGGFAAATNALVERFINFSRPFIFATAPPPALAAASLAALHVVQEERSLAERLWRNAQRVGNFLSANGFGAKSPSPIFPILIGRESEAVRISESLLNEGILIPAIRYPTVPKGKARLRLTVSAAHTDEDLDKLFRALDRVLSL